jgi:hypothetical protein
MLSFTRLLIEKTRDRRVIFEVGGQNFSATSKDEVLKFTHIPSGESIVTSEMVELRTFLTQHAIYRLPQIEEQLFNMVVEAVMTATLSPVTGMNRNEMKVFIGSLAESEPEDAEKYLRILGEIMDPGKYRQPYLSI